MAKMVQAGILPLYYNMGKKSWGWIDLLNKYRSENEKKFK